MSSAVQTQVKAPAITAFTPTYGGLLQRKCACGGTPGLDGECADCRRKRLSGQGSSLIQPKLRIGQPGDKYELEADHVAHAIMSMPDSQVLRQPEVAQLGLDLPIQRICSERNEEIRRQPTEDIVEIEDEKKKNEEILSRWNSPAGVGPAREERLLDALRQIADHPADLLDEPASEDFTVRERQVYGAYRRAQKIARRALESEPEPCPNAVTSENKDRPGKSPAGVGPARGSLRKAKPLKVRVTMVYTDFMRLALNHHYGLPGKASLKDCQLWMETTLSADWADIGYEYTKDTGNDGE